MYLPSFVKEIALVGCFGHGTCTHAVLTRDHAVRRSWNSEVVRM
jgi:hypothetical protein